MSTFPPLRNDRILRAARGEIPDKIPIWVMGQAGRYLLPEFMELKTNRSVMEICQSPELTCDVTLMPIRRFNFDAAVIFSDISIIPQALGMSVEMKFKTPGEISPEAQFEPGFEPILQGPIPPVPLSIGNIGDLIKEGAVHRLKHVGDAITLTRHKLEGQVPLIGVSGAPWTIMAYMIEGGSSKTFNRARSWFYNAYMFAHQLLQLLTDVIVDYLVMQVEAGAQILQVSDIHANFLNKKLYSEFGLPYLKQIRNKTKQKLQEKKLDEVPMILFAKGAHYCLPELADLGYEVLGIDWTIEPSAVKELLRGKNVTLQGNLDPKALSSTKEDLTKIIQDMVKEFGTQRYIVNLGDIIYPETSTKALEWFIEVVHNIQV